MSEECPKVTIMIPTYNQAHYIAQTIESALGQDYPNLEVVVSDDRSTDTTEEVVKQYLTDSRVKYFKNPTNLGRVKNYRKTLYEYATGKYALNLDGDDWLIDNNYISKAVEILENNDDVVMVFARDLVFYENENRLEKRKWEYRKSSKIMEGNQVFLDYDKISIAHLTVLYRREYALDVGFYERDLLTADGESILKIMLGNKVGFIDELVGVWRLHSANASQAKEPAEQIKGLSFVDYAYEYAKYNNFFEKKQLDRWKYYMSYYVVFPYFAEPIKKGEVKSALNFVKSLYKSRPIIALALLLDLRFVISKLLRKISRIFQKAEV